MQSLFQDQESEPPEAAAQKPLASVLIPCPVDKAYSYAVPDGLDLNPGDYVSVPLGSREMPGIVWGESGETVPAKKLKSVIALHDLPPMPDVARRFLDWVADYNMAPRGMVLKMALSVPGALAPPKTVTGYRLSGWVRELLDSSSPSPALLRAAPSPHGGEGRGEGDKNRYKEKPAEQLIEHSRNLRKNQTDTEKKLWLSLNNRQPGYKFRRQHPIPPYIADFACLEKNLIIELDGGQHGQQQDYDAQRTRFLEEQGFFVLRFWNNEVSENLEGVLVQIDEALKSLSPSPVSLRSTPSPHRGEGRGEGALSHKEKFLQQLSPQRQKIIDILADGQARRASDIAAQTGCTPSVVKTMAAHNMLEETDIQPPPPCCAPDTGRARIALSPDQKKAADALASHVRAGAYRATLLDGVTGAGKTEVYFEAAAQALDDGKQVLILLPEIALSNAFLDRFKKRFGCAPALWHSNLSDGQRRATWRGVAQGRTKVIVGARSALFLPYRDLGLIIVDEEHDPAYKQEEGVIYHARDMAIVRAHMGKIPVVLVSATPSLETMANVWAGKYELLHLPDRHGGAGLPQMHVIDMKADKPPRGFFIAPALEKALAENLEKGEQSLLFLNRRGYAPLTLCRSCGHRMSCPRCTAWLVEHRQAGRLSCHHCGYTMSAPKACPECGDIGSLAACGPGVERIHEEVKNSFPQARTIVLASDTAENPDDLRDLLRAIRDHEYDIVIGTQIIAKGHHFPHLTLVGVIDADLGLAGGDLRAGERTYQLLHQVAGRAGREDLPGHVYLQTFLPGNKVMQALAGLGRDLFLDVEAQERRAANMPPYTRLAGIIVAGKDENLVTETARALGKAAPQGDGIQTLGPAEAPFYRLRGNYRRRLLVRADKNLNIQKALAAWLSQVKIPSSIRIYVDIDPQNFM